MRTDATTVTPTLAYVDNRGGKGLLVLPTMDGTYPE
jgi:hypothetical protein